MIREISPQKTSPEPSIRNTAGSPAVKAASKIQPSASASSAASRSAASVAVSAGLPFDKLSSSIVSFARFFSLPLKPQMLADIRRQALGPLPQSTQANSAPASPAAAGDSSASLAVVKIREAFSLSAAAAESKGVELQDKGLESYAEAVDPEYRRRQDGGRRRRNKEQNEQGEKEAFKTGAITAGLLKKMALEYTEKNTLLEILNRLPGKNRQRWIVLPFDFIQDNTEFRVSMRVLLSNDKGSNSADCMVLDILMNGEEFERRQLFVMESANEKPVRLSVYNQHELPPKAHSRLKRELSELLEIPLERICVKCSAEAFPHEISCGGPLPSVDEAV